MRRPVVLATKRAAPRYPMLRVAWRILAATMPMLPAAAAHADATVPGEHQSERPKPNAPPLVVPLGGAPPAPRPVEPPKPRPNAPKPQPPRLGGKMAAPQVKGA